MQPLVLHVDDDRSYGDEVRKSLLADGVDLVRAGDGGDALDLLWGRLDDPRLPLPSLILSELVLPRMTGWEMLSYLAADPVLRRIPCVVLTRQPGEGERCRDLGAHFCWAKPATGAPLSALLRRLRPLLGRSVPAQPTMLVGPTGSSASLRRA